MLNTVVVCGCNFPNCPRTTIYEASERDYRIVLATDATSVLYDRALQELKNIDVLVMNTDECIAWLGAPSYFENSRYSMITNIEDQLAHM